VVKSDYKASRLLFWSDELLSLTKWAWYSTHLYHAHTVVTIIVIRAWHVHAAICFSWWSLSLGKVVSLETTVIV